MKVHRLHIHNFRSICDAEIFLTDYTLLVGANNAGKSNVIDALRFFFGDYVYNDDVDCPRIRNKIINHNDIWVEVEFSEVKHIDAEKKYANIIHDDKVSVRRTIAPKNSKSKRMYEFVGKDEKPVKRGKGTSEKEWKALLDKFIMPLSYLPSISNPSADIRLTGTSLLKDLIGDSLKLIFEKSQVVRGLQDTITKLVKGSKENKEAGENKVLEFEKKVSEEVQEWGATFTLGTKSLEVTDIVKTMLEVSICDQQTDGATDIGRFGSGFQRSLIFSIIKAAASIDKVGYNGTRRLLIFEEPETFLHPDQQEELARSLRKLAQEGFQVVCTSHSSNFVGRKMDDVPGIVRVMKNKGVTTTQQISKKTWSKIVEKGGNYPKYLKSYIKRNTSYLDAFRYACWFAGQRATICFAKQVLLIEGATEVALLARLQDEGKLKLPRGTVVIDCMGKFNIHRFMMVLRGWCIPFAVMYDNDSDKEGDKLEEQKAWNQFVEENAKLNPMARTLVLEGDLETELGVKKPEKGQNDIKPYQLLNVYEKGLCKNVERLCQRIEGLFSDVGCECK